MGIHGSYNKNPCFMVRIFLLFFLVLALNCCNNKKHRLNETIISSRKKPSKYISSIRIKSPQQNAVISVDKTLHIDFVIKKVFSKVDSSQIFLNGKIITTLYPSNFLKYKWNFSKKNYGVNKLKIKCFHTNGKIGNDFRTIICVPNEKTKIIPYRIIKYYPHNRKAFTQGLVFDDGYLYESTGHYGRSEIRKLAIKSGQILQKISIPKKYFSEGITIIKDTLYQLTWISGNGFIYNKKNLEKISSFSISSFTQQGWGITNVEDTLIISNGTHQMYFMDRKNFSIIKRLNVYDNNGYVSKLNELEYINGKIFANVWLTDTIAIIDPTTGFVTGKIDCSKLLSEKEKKKLNLTDDVLNGIAYNPENKYLYLTGKYWPKVFEIKLLDW